MGLREMRQSDPPSVSQRGRHLCTDLDLHDRLPDGTGRARLSYTAPLDLRQITVWFSAKAGKATLLHQSARYPSHRRCISSIKA